MATHPLHAACQVNSETIIADELSHSGGNHWWLTNRPDEDLGIL